MKSYNLYKHKDQFRLLSCGKRAEKHGLWPWYKWPYCLAQCFMYGGMFLQLIIRRIPGCSATDPVSAVRIVSYSLQSLPQTRLVYKQLKLIKSSHSNTFKATVGGTKAKRWPSSCGCSAALHQRTFSSCRAQPGCPGRSSIFCPPCQSKLWSGVLAAYGRSSWHVRGWSQMDAQS